MAWSFRIGARRAALAATAVCAGAWLCAAPAMAERLNEAVRSALRSNPEVRGAAAAARAAAETYEQANAGLFPTLDLHLGGGKEESESELLRSARIGSRTLNRQEASLMLRQNVYDGSQVRQSIERENFRFESARLRLNETADQVALRAAEAYLDTLRDEELVRLSVESLAAYEDVLAKTRLRLKNGVGQGADVAQAEARVALATSTLVSARASGGDSAARYFRVVGGTPSNLAEPEVPARYFPPSLDAARAQGAENAYGVAAAKAELSAAQANVGAVRADLLPRVDVELSANRNRNIDGFAGINNDNQAMVVMRYNLFRGGADQARIREAMERETVALEALRNAQQSTEESVSRAWIALAAAREKMVSLKAHADASVKVRQAYREQFELGRRSLLDLVNAENELYQARSALLAGKMALHAAEYRLLAAIGAMVKSLGLEGELQQVDIAKRDR